MCCCCFLHHQPLLLPSASASNSCSSRPSSGVALRRRPHGRQDHFGDLFPRNVDLVLNPGDRAAVPKAKFHGHDAGLNETPLPFVLSFAVRPATHLDVGVPDPSFWGWPE